jgi:hypothetical protein
MDTNAWPACGRQYEDREPPSCNILLMSKVLVGRHENVEAYLGGSKKVSIRKRRPADFKGRFDGESSQMLAKGNGRALIE